ncbi:dienelactone hydrolase family protein [Demequina rhizosphaerae]|uniref:dienelactone hydrolase family protein n=1 Tax=Demequina rhizosphaerae TaxID=1638985 RepID=UPI00078344E9|nr:dienelactone hydrolase family protein [Demequina rhizosphaerae]
MTIEAYEPWPPEGWLRSTAWIDGRERVFYVVGDRDGPGVVLLHEFPGIMRGLVDFANRLAADFRVVVPSIFGVDGAPTASGSLAQLCVNREMHAIARDGVSRTVPWLRDLAGEHAGADGGPYGVVGLCLTGSFALALATDPRVAAAVVGEPAVPPFPPTALGLSDEDREALVDRSGLRVQGYRYRRDCMSPPAKLRSAQRLLGEGRMAVFELDDHGERLHSTLTEHADPDAVDRVVAFLRERLG